MNKVTKANQALIDKEKILINKVGQSREAAFNRFPLVFTLLGAFGLVATFYGFEGIIDNIDFLSGNPWVILATGIGVLFATGSLYKKLQ